MGFSAVSTHVIWGLAFVGTAGLLLASVFGVGDTVSDATDLVQEREHHRLNARVSEATTSYDADTRTLTVELRNVGRVALDPGTLSFTMNGRVEEPSSVEVDGVSPAETVWLPEETARFVFEDKNGAPSRILVLTEHGVPRMTVFKPGPVQHLFVYPASADVVAGETQLFEAEGYDENWRRVTDLEASWTTDAGTVSPTTGDMTTLTAQEQAEDGLTVTATVDGLTATATVNVIPGPATTITVSPASVTLAPEASWTFTAEAYDQYGNAVDQESITWTATAGTVTNDGVFTAPATEGSVTVTASADGVTDSAAVTVSRYAYASTTFTDVEGGSVTDAAAFTSADGSVAVFEETQDQTPNTQPAEADARTFENDPIPGWTITANSARFNLNRVSDGVGSSWAMQLEKRQNNAHVAHVDYEWTQAETTDAVNARLQFDYRFPSGDGANRHLAVKLIAPDGIETTLTEATTVPAAWTGVDVPFADADLSQAGTYTLRFVIGLDGRNDDARFDNVILTWDAVHSARFGKAFTVEDLPQGESVTRTLEVRYRTTDAEGLRLVTEGPADSWTHRQTFTAPTPGGDFVVATRTLTADEILGNAVNLRLIDDAQVLDPDLATWEVDYIRVRVTAS